MKNKILILVFTILTFGIFLIPKTFAFSTTQLDNVNRVVTVGRFGTSNTPMIYFNKLDSETSFYVTIQCFNKNELNTPIDLTTLGITPQCMLSVGNWSNMTVYTSNNNYGYRSSSLINYTSQTKGIVLNGGGISILNDYVFNVCVVRTYQNGFIGHFVPNTFYSPNEGTKGIFSNASVYLSLDGQSSLDDMTQYMLGYNIISLGAYTKTIYNQNNKNGYQYHLRVTFENGVSLLQLPNLYIKFLELEYINVNGTLYSYNDAKTTFNWLYNNIVLYNDNASLYVNNDLRLSNQSNIIYELRFRLPDYTFKSSTYYDSALGLEGYLNGVLISSFEYSNVESYNLGYQDGAVVGYNKGYNDGLNKGLSEERGHFDNLMFAIGDVPMRIISSVLNFNILGFNLLSFFMGIITLMLFIYVLRRFKE